MQSEDPAEAEPNSDGSGVPPGLDPDVLERLVSIEAMTVHVDGFLHQATTFSKDGTRAFTFHSDEPEDLTGNDEHPNPLHYFTAAIGL